MKPGPTGYNLTTHINNFDLSYDDIGEGAIPIIFLHGFPFDKSMWAGQLDFLRSGYRVIACDIRGFGKSHITHRLDELEAIADDVVVFMSKLNIYKAIICGLSMGGFIALNAQKRFHDRFEALILCDTQCIADTPEVNAKRYKTIDEINTNGVTGFNEGFIKSVFHKDSLTGKKEIVEKVRGVVFSNSQQIITMGLKALAERAETCSTLDEIDIPTLIVCGREDVVTPLAQSESMHKAIEGSILQVIDDAGHVSNLEQPFEFNKHLYDFLATLKGLDVQLELETKAY